MPQKYFKMHKKTLDYSDDKSTTLNLFLNCPIMDEYYINTLKWKKLRNTHEQYEQASKFFDLHQ